MTIQRGPARALLDEGVALLDSLEPGGDPILRWYRCTDTALVLGRGQQAAAFRGTDLPLVGRFSGGGAVLMDDGLLSLDVLIPADHALLAGDLGMPFDHVGGAWAQALTCLDIPQVDIHRGPATANRRGSERERLLAAICYATLGRGEVTSAGRKIVGLAQRRRKPGALVQCGLLRHWNPQPLVAALGGEIDEDILNAAAGIDDFVADPPPDEVITTEVEAALDRVMADL